MGRLRWCSSKMAKYWRTTLGDSPLRSGSSSGGVLGGQQPDAFEAFDVAVHGSLGVVVRLTISGVVRPTR
jgi:hypothetical protein